MATRIASRLETIIPLVKAQIVVTNAILDSSLVFVALAEDSELAERSPAASFIAIKPDRFPVWEEAVSGGGNDVLWVDGSWELTWFFRYGADVDFSDDSWLLDPQSGILPQWSNLLSVLQLFDPKDSNGNLVLAEPMRLAASGWQFMPRVEAGVANWGRLKSYWEVKYTHQV